MKFADKKQKLLQHDQHLKKFQYKQGLLAVLKTNQTNMVMAYLQEIIQRQGLEIALGKLDQV